MDEIISRLDILMKTIEILDGQKHVRTSSEEYSKIADCLNDARSQLRIHQNELEKAKEYTRTLQEKKEYLEYLNKKTLAIKSYIRDVPTPSPGLEERHSSIQISQSPGDFFGSIQRNPMTIEANPVRQPLANSTIDNIQPIKNPPSSNLPPTPKPRANLETSVSYITNNEFTQIPQYMKGRLKYDELNTFIDLFNEILNKKYTLLGKPRSQIKAQSQMEMIQKWNSQKTKDMEGQYFIGPEDFSALKNYKLSKRDYSILVIMRHLKKIKEMKQKSLKFFSVLF